MFKLLETHFLKGDSVGALAHFAAIPAGRRSVAESRERASGGSIVNRPVWLVPGGSFPRPWGGGRAVGSWEGGLSDRKGGGRGILFVEGAVGDAWSACAPSELSESMVLGTASPGWRLNACVPSGLWNPYVCVPSGLGC